MEPTHPAVPSTEAYPNYAYYDPIYPGTSLTDHFDYKPVLLVLVFCLGLMGNMTVIWVLLRYIKLRTMTDVCLLNLAVSDLVQVLTIPLWAYHIQHPGFAVGALCKVMAGVYKVGLYSSTLLVTLMSVDRYLAIVHAVAAVRARTLSYGRAASLVIWAVSLAASLPSAIFTIAGQDGCQLVEDSWEIYSNFSENVVTLFICLPVMVYCYMSILFVLQKSRNSKKARAMKLIFTIVCLFVVCWVPYNIVVFLHTLLMFDIGNTNERQLETAVDVTEFIALAHCCVNPVVYAFVGEKFRKYLGSMLSKYPFCKQLGAQTASTSRASDNETSNTTA